MAAAHRIGELEPTAEVTLFEASDRLGGIIQTVRQDSFLIEQGADSFITTSPWAIDLCRRVGLADELISTNSQHRGAMVVLRGKLQRIPDAFVLMSPQKLWPTMRSPILSLPGKLRLACERFVKRDAPTKAMKAWPILPAAGWGARLLNGSCSRWSAEFIRPTRKN